MDKKIILETIKERLAELQPMNCETKYRQKEWVVRYEDVKNIYYYIDGLTELLDALEEKGDN